MKRNQIIFAAVIDECKKPQFRLDYAYTKLADKLPFTEDASDLTDEIIGHLIIYFSFFQTQEVIGQKLFKGVLQFLGEEV